ncbi:MAG: MFS transporter [Chloroflexi bacterium]|nr:MFS transporter [Chloroflexota bacterium]
MISSTRNSYVAMSGLSIGIFIAALDQTVVVTALPSVISDLSVSFTRLNEAAWIVTGYLLGYTVAMPFLGRVADVYGHRRTYLACSLMFVAGSLLCGVSRDLYWLIGARMLQAVGGGAIVPVAVAIAGYEFDARRRGLVLGAIGAIAEAGGVLGPLYGAFVVEHLSWRWIFYLNLPIGLLMIGLTYFFAREGRRSSGALDFVGAALISASLAALTIGLSQEADTFASSTPLFVAFLLLFALFVLAESRASHPLLDLRLFTRMAFSSGIAANFLVGVALIIAMVDVPLMATTILQRSPLDGGLMLVRLTAALPIGAIVGGMLCQRTGLRATAASGLAVSATGLYLTAQWTSQVDEWRITRDLALAGVGFGLVIAPITSSVLSSAGSEHSGTASAYVTVLRTIGMMVGLSALTSWGLGRFNSLVGSIPLPLPIDGEATEAFQQRLQVYQQEILQATNLVFNEVFLAAAGVCLMAIIAVLFLGNRASLQELAES